ncbi:MAG: alpha-ketoglutarate-dependent dioxygenase AlkB [Pseudomonadota bacterium]
MSESMAMSFNFEGAIIWKDLLDREAQQAMVEALRKVAGVAPFRNYETPGGQKMSVKMSGAGPVAWMSGRSGYGYSRHQPDGGSWPDIPGCVLSVWREVAGTAPRPDSCLINFYSEGARMGLHQDQDEANTQWPVVSISLGDDALFRIGGLSRSAPTKSIWLNSGDVIVLQGPSRLAYHGVDRIKFASSNLLQKGGRLNVTLRVAR